MDRVDNESQPIDGYVLIQASSGSQVPELAELITQIPGVIKADRVRGAYDVIAELREPSEDVRVSPAARAISELDGVLRAIPLRVASPVSASRGSDSEAA